MSDKICDPCSKLLSEIFEDADKRVAGRYTFSPRDCDLCAHLQAISTIPEIGSDEAVSISMQFEERAWGDYGLDVCIGDSDEFNTFLVMGIASPANQLDPSREAVDATLTSSSIGFLREKLRECLTTHEKCQGLASTECAVYPTRLLNLDNFMDGIIKLEDTNHETSGPYVTLSHCWGGLTPFQLTKSTESELRKGLRIGCLPKTFQDAIAVCYSYYCDYLWIDSLCIFQDDKADWHSEAASMRQVYAFSYFNIAASGGIDGSWGLNFVRNVKALMPFTITAPEQFWLHGLDNPPIRYAILPKDRYDDVVMGPLNKRGWVLQEWILSTRIMHFSLSGVYWECPSNRSNDIYQTCLPSDYFNLDNDIDKLKHHILQRSGGNHNLERTWTAELYHGWSALCIRYSRCKLTYGSDKLIAIGGIIEEMERITGDKSVFGLWRQYLLPQLLHQTIPEWTEEQEPKLWRAPSWSWASHNMVMCHQPHILCGYGWEKAAVEQVLVDNDSDGHPKAASLLLRGKVVHAVFSTHTAGNSWAYDMVCVKSGAVKRFTQCIFWDHITFLHRSGIVCLALYEDWCRLGLYTTEEFYRKSSIRCVLGIILLQKVSSDPIRYKRVGVLFLKEDDYAWYTSEESKEEHTLTTI